MFYKIEFNIEDFPAWSGGLDTKNDILKADKVEEFNQFIEFEFAEDEMPTDTSINDFLWFERDTIYDFLGLDENGQLIED